MSRVLVVDDEPAVCWSVSELLTDRGHAVASASSVEQAWESAGAGAPDAVVLDVRLPGEDGLSALPEFRRRWPATPVIVITAFGDLPTAVTALERGAFDYLVKPFELAEFAAVVERALAPPPPAPRSIPESVGQTLIGRSPAMQAVFRQIALVAPTGSPVLLVGETGTGKEVAARAIHQHSGRATGPFVPVCPAALNPAVIESELFGPVRGAFTGAAEDRPGVFEIARNGTIFLDEIADAPLAVQVKLLRVLESRRFCPVGSGVERATDARFIAATHRDLPAMIRAGTFREDLYHRLNVFTITLPPLRDRPEDVPPLAEFFLGQLGEGLRPPAIGDEFLRALKGRDWPGNVRELKHAVERAAIVSRGNPLAPDHLPPAQACPAPASTEDDVARAISAWVQSRMAESDRKPGDLHRQLLAQVEAALFREVLEATDQNRTAAARLLGLDRTTLRTRLK